MKFLITALLATVFSLGFSQSIDPLSKAMELQETPFVSEKVDYKADHSGIFGYVPDFFSKAAEEDLVRIFSAPNFERFSVTGYGVVYERKKGKEISKDELAEIVKQIFSHRDQFATTRKQQGDVMVNNLFDFEEKSILWPSGLVVVFRNKQLTHVWLDFK